MKKEKIDDLEKKKLLKLLKENLTVELEELNNYSDRGETFQIVIKFDGEHISTSEPFTIRY